MDNVIVFVLYPCRPSSYQPIVQHGFSLDQWSRLISLHISFAGNTYIVTPWDLGCFRSKCRRQQGIDYTRDFHYLSLRCSLMRSAMVAATSGPLLLAATLRSNHLILLGLFRSLRMAGMSMFSSSWESLSNPASWNMSMLLFLFIFTLAYIRPDIVTNVAARSAISRVTVTRARLLLNTLMIALT